MFTGIIEVLGQVKGWRKGAKGSPPFLEIASPRITRQLKAGASLAVNGVCLTVVKKKGTSVFFNVSEETRKRSTLGQLMPGQSVHLERPLKAGGRIEGHFVLGHADGVGRICKTTGKGKEKSFQIAFPPSLGPWFVEKGSVAVDGVSLTVGKVSKNAFWVHLTPYTIRYTRFKDYKAGRKVNLEGDLLAKLARKWGLVLKP